MPTFNITGLSGGKTYPIRLRAVTNVQNTSVLSLTSQTFTTIPRVWYSAGVNEYGIAAVKETTGSEVQPSTIRSHTMCLTAGLLAGSPLLTSESKVFFGYKCILVLKPDKTLWAMGWNIGGRFGRGASNNNVVYTGFVQIFSNCDDVSLGGTLTLFVRSGATWYVAGVDNAGNTLLTHLSTGPFYSFTPIASAFDRIVAGPNVTFAFRGTTLFARGNNAKGELGIGITNFINTNINGMFVVPGSWVDVKPGDGFTYALSSGGQWHASGENVYGQCSVDSPPTRNTFYGTTNQYIFDFTRCNFTIQPQTQSLGIANFDKIIISGFFPGVFALSGKKIFGTGAANGISPYTNSLSNSAKIFTQRLSGEWTDIEFSEAGPLTRNYALFALSANNIWHCFGYSSSIYGNTSFNPPQLRDNQLGFVPLSAKFSTIRTNEYDDISYGLT